MQSLNQLNLTYNKSYTNKRRNVRTKTFRKTSRHQRNTITFKTLIIKTVKAIQCFVCSIISCDNKKASGRFLDQKLSFTSSDNLWSRIDR